MEAARVPGQQVALPPQRRQAGQAPQPGETPSAPDARVNDIARDFEAMVTSAMLQPMFKSLSGQGLFGGGHAEEVWRSFMVDEYAKLMAERESLGIAGTVRKSIDGTYSAGFKR